MNKSFNHLTNIKLENIKLGDIKLEKIKLEKIDPTNTYIPKLHESNYLLKYNYNIPQLKTIAKKYKLKLSGNKAQLTTRIYSFLYLSGSVVNIQKIIRGYIQRKISHYHGPALKNRSLCTNLIDFLSMEEITTIPNNHFFSFKDQDGFIYGFDILSLYNLIYKCDGLVKNPFNTKVISKDIIDKFNSLIRLSRVLHINIFTELQDITSIVSNKKTIELKALSLFQNIDYLGNYSDSQWFLSLNRTQIIKFTKELIDIWSYRALLNMKTKREVCPPIGNPFSNLPGLNVLQSLDNIDDVRKIILDCMEKMVNTGIDKDSKCLGAYYVLGAITLVNNDAATSLPWLYQSVCHM